MGLSLFDLILMTDRCDPEFMPIEKDGKRGDRQYFCVECGKTATKIAYFQTQVAIIVERYCDPALPKYAS
jgi:hypothetical protein